MDAKIQFIKGLDEKVLPDVRLTRSRDGSTGTATIVAVDELSQTTEGTFEYNIVAPPSPAAKVHGHDEEAQTSFQEVQRRIK